MCIPRNARSIDGSAFEKVIMRSIVVAEGNLALQMSGPFLMDIGDHKLVRNFSTSSNVEIGRDIEILGSSCFSSCTSLSSISFESDSRLTRIDSNAFS
jgi:hypothetical protein